MFSTIPPETTIAQLLTRQPDRWHWLKHFVAEWHRPFDETNHISEPQFVEVEQRLGVKLPLAVREWYQLAGKQISGLIQQDHWLELSDLRVKNDLLIVCGENQLVVEWGILLNTVHLEDPPVMIFEEYVDRLGFHQSCIQENRSFSEFVFQKIVQETIFGYDGYGGNVIINPEIVALVEAHFEPLEFPDWHWPRYPNRFFGRVDTILSIDSSNGEDPWLWFTARTQSALEYVLDVVGSIEWESLVTESAA